MGSTLCSLSLNYFTYYLVVHYPHILNLCDYHNYHEYNHYYYDCNNINQYNDHNHKQNHLSINLSTHPSVHSTFCLSVCPHFHLFFMSVCSPIHISISKFMWHWNLMWLYHITWYVVVLYPYIYVCNRFGSWNLQHLVVRTVYIVHEITVQYTTLQDSTAQYIILHYSTYCALPYSKVQ